MTLTQHFTSEELTASSTARARGIDNTPTPSALANLQSLCDNVLEPLRQWYGRAIIINSGYRCPTLNKAVGGASNSQHLTGEAADIHFNSRDTGRKLFEYIRLHLPFDQLIMEHNKAGVYWIHVSYTSKRPNRKQVINDLLKK